MMIRSGVLEVRHGMLDRDRAGHLENVTDKERLISLSVVLSKEAAPHSRPHLNKPILFCYHKILLRQIMQFAVSEVPPFAEVVGEFSCQHSVDQEPSIFALFRSYSISLRVAHLIKTIESSAHIEAVVALAGCGCSVTGPVNHRKIRRFGLSWCKRDQRQINCRSGGMGGT